jgi:hypothetical protein
MRAGAVVAVLAAIIGWVSPAHAGVLSLDTTHDMTAVDYFAYDDGPNDLRVTARAAEGGASSLTVVDALAQVSSATPPWCLPLGLHAGRCSSFDVIEGFSVGFYDGPARFSSPAPLPLTLGVSGSPEADHLDLGRADWASSHAGAGDDTVITASPGEILGEEGDDTLLAANGAWNRIFCGPGTDTVAADADDQLFDCENVTLG